MFYDGKSAVLAAGLIDMGGGAFYQWSLFGDRIKKYHLRHIIRYFNNYLSMLDCECVHHIIRKDLPWTKDMMRLQGFEYVRDEDEFTEHWLRIK